MQGPHFFTFQKGSKLKEGEQQVHPERNADAAAGSQGVPKGARQRVPSAQVQVLLITEVIAQPGERCRA